MKNKDLKKGKESIIGKIIYGFLLFMPLLAILSTILVNTFNQKANETTETTIVEVPTYYKTNEVNNVNDFVVGNIYTLTFNNTQTTVTTNEYLLLDSYYIVDFQMVGYYSSSAAYNIPYILFNTNNYLYLLDNNSNNITTAYYYSYIEIDFVYSSSNNFNLFNLITPCEKQYIKEYTQEEQITYVQNDIFYYAVDKVEQSSLFNWSKNSIIYTGIHNTCIQLSITTTFVPMLLAYWLIISVIYILYDIILMILIILHNRVHRLQDSMS